MTSFPLPFKRRPQFPLVMQDPGFSLNESTIIGCTLKELFEFF